MTPPFQLKWWKFFSLSHQNLEEVLGTAGKRALGWEVDASSLFGGAGVCVAAPHRHSANLYYISTDKTATWHCVADVCNFCQDVEQRPGTWVETGARRSSGVAALC